MSEPNTDFVPFRKGYEWFETTDSENIDTAITNLNTSFANYNPSLTSIGTRTDELRAELKEVAFSGEASDVTISSTAQFVTETEKATWSEENQKKILFDDDNDLVLRGVAPNQEDVTYAFRYAAGTPKMSDITNDGSPTTTPQPYLTQRDIFGLYNVTVDTFEGNTGGEDKEYFSRIGVIDLTDYLYDGTNLNRCIYKEEYDNIEDYTALISFNQTSADATSISKITKTAMVDGRARIQFGTTVMPTSTLTVNSIIFLKEDKIKLQDGDTEVDFLETHLDTTGSSGSTYGDNGCYIALNTSNTYASGFDAQLGVVFTGFNTSGGSGYSVILARPNESFGIKYDSTTSAWYWTFYNNGTAYTSTSAVELSTYYHIEIATDSTNKEFFVNGQKVITVPVSSLTESAGAVYLFSDTNKQNGSQMKIYYLKMFDVATSLLKEDCILCLHSSTPCIWDGTAYRYAVADATGSDAHITGGDEPDISEYIMIGLKPPTTSTVGNLNQFYRVKNTNDYYICLGYNSSTGYIWQYSYLGLVYTDI